MNTAKHTWTALLAGAMIATLALWLVSLAPSPQVALGQVPDSGLQRQQMIEELKASNRKLDDIAGLLREIRDTKPQDEKKTGPAGKATRTQP
jgi:hypothetical protein